LKRNQSKKTALKGKLTDPVRGDKPDIQRLLRTQIDVISDDLYVLAEEFSEWEETKRRLDA